MQICNVYEYVFIGFPFGPSHSELNYCVCSYSRRRRYWSSSYTGRPAITLRQNRLFSGLGSSRVSAGMAVSG